MTLASLDQPGLAPHAEQSVNTLISRRKLKSMRGQIRKGLIFSFGSSILNLQRLRRRGLVQNGSQLGVTTQDTFLPKLGSAELRWSEGVSSCQFPPFTAWRRSVTAAGRQ